MKTEVISDVWELYRDHADNFKEPFRKRMHELDDYVDALIAENRRLQDENATLRQQLANATESMGRVEERCAKLRELVRQWYPHMLKRVGRDALKQWGQMDVIKELGIEVTGE